MAQHIIPDSEKELHILSEECLCVPDLKIDKESGEMVWIHTMADWERLLEDFVNIN